MELLKRIQTLARQCGERLAVRTGECALTYRQLEEQSGKLAAYLLSLGGEKQSPVVVYGHKHPLMLVCFLACVKAGRAYCPVDVSVPLNRVQAIAEEVGTPFLFAVEELELELPGKIGRAEIEEAIRSTPQGAPASAAVGAEDVFYIIFTSGSTGTPKGVQITMDCLNHYLDWAVTLGTSEEEKQGKVFLNQAPFSFDLSVMDLYTCLACGGTLWTLEKATQGDYRKLLASLAESGTGIWVSTPSFADICLTDPAFDQTLMPQMELFLFCGETLTNATAKKLHRRFPNAVVVNTYGPTESTVAMTEVVITPELCAEQSPLPVGRVKPGTRVEIRAEDGTALPDGEHGEIVIIGNTVSTGYFHQPELTDKAFFASDCDGSACRGYRTGDEGYLVDGMLHYCGRIDLQVKLHGYRIEVEDIENNLLKLPQLRAAVVVPNVRGGKVKSLAAFVVSDHEGDDFEAGMALKEDLKQFLPDYMIPKKVVFLDRIPMTANGKADRKQLGGMLS